MSAGTVLGGVRNMLSSKRTIYTSDGKTRCREVFLREGELVKDALDRTCTAPSEPICPVARLYFAICDYKTFHCLSPYYTVTAAESKRPFQLRVFVNSGQNGAQFQKTSKAAYKYYLSQLREDFVKGQLYMLSVNSAVWMAAIDMAREAVEKNKKLEDFFSPRELQKFMPIQLYQRWKADAEVKGQLAHVFQKFSSGSPVTPEHLKAKFIEVYEKDEMCGTHIFKLKQHGTLGPRVHHVLLVVSTHTGISKMQRTDSTSDKEPLCQFDQLEALHVCERSLTATLTITKRDPVKVIFADKQELVAFAVVVNAYYRLLVDANAVILEGALRPPERCFLVGKDDGRKKDLCHACIGPEAVEKVLTQFRKEDGHFMVRESRNEDGAYTLSLCHQGRVLNYRIVRSKEDGMLCFQDPTSGKCGGEKFPTLHSLLEKHKHSLNGFPTYLKMNCAPNVTGRIPILPRDDHVNPVYSIIEQLKLVGVAFIDYEEFAVETELGSGHFSTVYRAVWKTTNTKVAIKVPTMKEANAEAVMRELKREIETMNTLDHPNIVKLLGITQAQHFLTFIGQFPMVVMEFVEQGSLRDYLNKLRKEGRGMTQHTLQVLLRFTQQIADGMKYLELKKVVHRDLAARNVLVVSEDQIKISDFGLARQRYEEKAYYQGKEYKDLPIFWYAPECLETLKFTHTSDLWSYGVTAWEIFTIGEQPPSHLHQHIKPATSNTDAFQSLARYYRQGTANRLPIDRMICPPSVRDLVRSCWELDPTLRPSFDHLALQFALITNSTSFT